MTTGGSGFIILLLPSDKDYRLAYMQVLRDLPSTPAGGCDGELELKFYQLWNMPLWDDMLHDYPDHFTALEKSARNGLIKVVKLIKSPTGKVRVREFDLVNSDWIAGDEEFTVDKVTLPRTIRINCITSHLRPEKEESTS